MIMETVFYRLPSLIWPFVILLSIFLLLNRFKKKLKLDKILQNVTLLEYVLLIWIFFGYLTLADFSERCGCIVFDRSPLSLDYILLSFFSLLLVGLSVFELTKRFSKLFLSIELIYWLFKLFFIKSGYVGGLGIMMFNYYDYIALTIRLLLITSVFKLQIKVYLILISSFIIISLKIIAIPCQDNFVYEDIIRPAQLNNRIEKLAGKWSGEVTFECDTSIKYQNDSTGVNYLISIIDSNDYYDSTILRTLGDFAIEFTNTRMILDSIPDLAKEYKLLTSISTKEYLRYIPTELNYEPNLGIEDSIWSKMLIVSFGKVTKQELHLEFNERYKLQLNKNSR